MMMVIERKMIDNDRLRLRLKLRSIRLLNGYWSGSKLDFRLKPRGGKEEGKKEKEERRKKARKEEEKLHQKKPKKTKNKRREKKALTFGKPRSVFVCEQ
jgi:hypothetical protein